MKTLIQIAKEIGWKKTDDLIAEAVDSADKIQFSENKTNYIIGYVNGKYKQAIENNSIQRTRYSDRTKYEDLPQTD